MATAVAETRTQTFKFALRYWDRSQAAASSAQGSFAPGSDADSASRHVGALAAVLHYLAAFSQAVTLQRGDLRPLADRVACSGLLGAGPALEPESASRPAAERAAAASPGCAATAGSDSVAASANLTQELHPLVGHALARITLQQTMWRFSSGAQLAASRSSSQSLATAQPLFPADGAPSQLAAYAELLDGLLALQSALGGNQLVAALPRAVAAAVDPQARLRQQAL